MHSFFKDELSLTGNCPEKRCCVSGKKTEHLFFKDAASLKKRRSVFFFARQKVAFASFKIATVIQRADQCYKTRFRLFIGL
jgi:hypothetical protein